MSHEQEPLTDVAGKEPRFSVKKWGVRILGGSLLLWSGASEVRAVHEAVNGNFENAIVDCSGGIITGIAGVACFIEPEKRKRKSQQFGESFEELDERNALIENLGEELDANRKLFT